MFLILVSNPFLFKTMPSSDVRTDGSTPEKSHSGTTQICPTLLQSEHFRRSKKQQLMSYETSN